MPLEHQNIRVIRELNDIVNSRHYQGMDPLFGSDFIDHNPAWSVQNLAELKKIISDAHIALDMHSTQEQIYSAEGNRVVIHLCFTGKHIGDFLGFTPTGHSISWTSIEIYRLENQRIVERWVQADTVGLMRQLGSKN